MQVTLDTVHHRYGSTDVIHQLNLTIESGGLVSLLGPSGCGKTTLLRILAGFVTPTSGRVWFANEDVTHRAVHQREIGMVFQDYALFPDRDVLSNVMFGLQARKVPGKQAKMRALEMLERVGLHAYAGHKPQALSGGQRQRVAMARALVIQPKLLLLDEPLSALDASLRGELRSLIRQLQRESAITTVFVTHDQEEALAISDQVIVMQAGVIVQKDDPESIYRTPNSAFAAQFVGDSNLLRIQAELSPTDDGLRRFSTDIGIVCSTCPDTFNQLCYVAVRGEQIALSPCSPVTESGLVGTIESVAFLGATVSYEVLVGGQHLRVNCSSQSSASVYQLGQRVRLQLPLDAPVVVG